eukprot:COSAG04_NODE_664_length_11441_cov_5.400458_2_plen_61_part_00
MVLRRLREAWTGTGSACTSGSDSCTCKAAAATADAFLLMGDFPACSWPRIHSRIALMRQP